MKTILDRLEMTEKEFGTRPAVDDGVTCLNYTELAETARGIGSILADKIEKNEPVAILAEKSTATLCCMYGVVYAGGFYVSVNPEQPPERIRKRNSIVCVMIIALVLFARKKAISVPLKRGRTVFKSECFRNAGALIESRHY